MNSLESFSGFGDSLRSRINHPHACPLLDGPISPAQVPSINSEMAVTLDGVGYKILTTYFQKLVQQSLGSSDLREQCVRPLRLITLWMTSTLSSRSLESREWHIPWTQLIKGERRTELMRQVTWLS